MNKKHISFVITHYGEEAVLALAGKFEAGWFKCSNVPLGLSVFAVAKKNSEA